MAIRFHYRYDDKERRDTKMEEFHKALVGSPAYINNEIAICEDGDCCFVLIVGNDNNNDLDVKN